MTLGGLLKQARLHTLQSFLRGLKSGLHSRLLWQDVFEMQAS